MRLAATVLEELRMALKSDEVFMISAANGAAPESRVSAAAMQRRVLVPHLTTRLLLSAAAILSSALATTSAQGAGTWTMAPSSSTNGGPAFGLWLLTDGTVLSHGNALNHWVILTPDKTGSYANGTWKTVASSAYARGGAQEHILKDGRFFEAGGEYIYVYPGCASNCTQPANGSALFKNVEIYDPVANTWTVEASGLYDIGDTGSATLADGRILDSTRASSATQIYDPATNTWTSGPNIPSGSGDENAWASLQNGGILAVAPDSASIYNPATGTWIRTGAYPAGLSTTLSTGQKVNLGDVAGVSLMFDGRVIAYGFGKTVIYTPGATAADAGTWALGPAMLSGNEAEDEYTVTEPNGKVMVATYPFQGSPNVLQEFDPTANTWTAITPPPDTGNPYPISYLNLPNGQVMITAGARDWLYTPDSAPQDAWRPTVSSVVFNSGTTYTLTGTQISGLINGGDEGDDMTMAENYPIVWLKDTSGNVYYCRSFNFSNMMPSQGSAVETCQFTTPAALPNGSYSLFVSAVGVQSKDPFPFTVGVGGGGAPGTGGAPSTGGAAGTGGAKATGGAKSTGGAAPTGGTSSIVANGTGGSQSTGGAVAVASGGTVSGGAKSTTGGLPNIGGASASPAGGLSSTGGNATNSTTGGKNAGGLANATGGMPTNGGAGNAMGGTLAAAGTSSTSGGTSDNAGSCSCRAAGLGSRTPAWMSLGIAGMFLLRARRRRARR